MKVKNWDCTVVNSYRDLRIAALDSQNVSQRIVSGIQSLDCSQNVLDV